jgi:F-type H+-transporting ATPase subunit c
MNRPATRSACLPDFESSNPVEEAVVVKMRFALMFTFVVLILGLASPAFAQEPAAAAASASTELVRWSIITAGFALAFAAAVGALSQAKSLSAAVEGIARNPAAANDIRGNLILGLVLIESLVIYVLLISLILFFIKPFTA